MSSSTTSAFYDLSKKAKELEFEHALEVMEPKPRTWLSRRFRGAPQTAAELENAAAGYTFVGMDGEFKPRGALRTADQYAERIANGKVEIDKSELRSVVNEGYEEGKQALKTLEKYEQALVTQQSPAWKQLDGIVSQQDSALHALEEKLSTGGTGKIKINAAEANQLNTLLDHTNLPAGHTRLVDGAEITQAELRKARTGLDIFHTERQSFLDKVTETAREDVAKQRELITEKLANIETKTKIPRSASLVATAEKTASGTLAADAAKAVEKEGSHLANIGKNLKAGPMGLAKLGIGAGLTAYASKLS